MTRWTINLAVLAALTLSAAPPALAKAAKAPPPSLAFVPFDETRQHLVSSLSHDPTLMHIDYLRYLIGPPDNENTQNRNPNPHYLWYNLHSGVKYELSTKQMDQGRTIETALQANLNGAKVPRAQIQALLGDPQQRMYDYQGHIVEVYSTAPYTFLCFTTPAHAFYVERVKIVYQGPPLPRPSDSAIQMAHDQFILRARQLGTTEDIATNEAVPHLQAHVGYQPTDAEAHLLLARALQRHSLVHEALGEYKTALALSGNNPEVQRQALDALRAMNLINVPQPPQQQQQQNGTMFASRSGRQSM